MTDPLLFEPPLVARAQRLLAVSSVAPSAVLLVVGLAMTLHNHADGGYVALAISGMVMAIVVVWPIYWSIRRTPDSWLMGSSVCGVFEALIFVGVTADSPEDGRFGLATPSFVVVVVVVTLGILALSWLPARRAAWLVLADLSSDVVHSSLVLRFTSRVSGRDILAVTPHSLEIMRRNSGHKAERSYPLTDVATVAVRTETNEDAHPVPGITTRTIRVDPGEVVVVDLPNGQLVFPAKHVEQLTRFIEERRAVVGAG